MATALVQMGSQAQSASNPSATISAQVQSNPIASAGGVTTPPYFNVNGLCPFVRFAPAAAPLTNGTQVADLVMPAGVSNPGSWYVVIYNISATPSFSAPVTLIQVGMQPNGSPASSVNGTIGPSNSGLIGTTLTTPPYVVNNQVAPFLRFASTTNYLTSGGTVVDVVMPLGGQNPGAFSAFVYGVNATPALT
jgi:hypothetical protein